MSVPKALQKLYEKLSAYTKPACDACPQAETEEYRCCYPEACEMALMYSEWKGSPLQRTEHPVLPLMGESGCSAPPHLRPMCTGYVCPSQKLDPEWMEGYQALREEIADLERRSP